MPAQTMAPLTLIRWRLAMGYMQFFNQVHLAFDAYTFAPERQGHHAQLGLLEDALAILRLRNSAEVRA